MCKAFIPYSPPLRISSISQTRFVSSSPYGRTHVWKRRPPALPKPVVPKFPQLVIRSDGTSFTHWTTSPRSVIRLTRDTTNNPLWNTGTWSSDLGVEEESALTGRLGRFTRKFEELGKDSEGSGWMDTLVEADVASSDHAKPTKQKSSDKKSTEKEK